MADFGPDLQLLESCATTTPMLMHAFPFRHRTTLETHAVLTARTRVRSETGLTVCGLRVEGMMRLAPSLTHMVATTCDHCTASIDAMLELFERAEVSN